MRLQQEQLSQEGSAVNEIRDVFVDTVKDDIQAFKAANPAARFEDFVRWHSPRDWAPSATNRAVPRSFSPPALGELSARMQGANPLRTLYDATPAVAASHQKRLFKASLGAELALDFLRTLSPLAATQQLLPPFLAAACVLLRADEETAAVPAVAEAISSLETAAHALSLQLDRRGEMTEASLEACEVALSRAETVTSEASALLRVTGDAALVDALLRRDFDVELADALQDSRAAVLRLLQERLARSESDACCYEAWGIGKRSSEETALGEFVEEVGYRMYVRGRGAR